MCESNNCLSCLAYTFMVLGLSACLIAFAAPFWLVYDYENVSHTGISFVDKAIGSFASDLATAFGEHAPWSEGLFGFCNNNPEGRQCKWVWENDLQLERKLDDWQKASQGLYMGGVILILFAGLISTLHTCCCCCKRSFSIRTALGSLVFAAVLCIGASLTVYGVFAERSGKLRPPVTFFWGFYLGIAGVASCLLASVLYFIDGCMTKNYDGYHMTRVV